MITFKRDTLNDLYINMSEDERKRFIRFDDKEITIDETKFSAAELVRITKLIRSKGFS